MPYSACPPPLVIPDTPEALPYARERVFGVVDFSWCHDYVRDRHPFRTDDDWVRGPNAPICGNRTRMGDRDHNWCLRCSAGYPVTHLDKADSSRERDGMSLTGH